MMTENVVAKITVVICDRRTWGGGFYNMVRCLHAVRLKHAANHGKKSTSLVSSPLDLHTCGKIYKHILKNYSTKHSVCSMGFDIIATSLFIIMCILV